VKTYKSDYCDCTCRDCRRIASTDGNGYPTLCDDCAAAGCDANGDSACLSPEKKYLTPHDYEMAMHSQCACNVSGLVHTLAETISRVWNEAHRDGHGTDWVNNHPLVRLYVEQLQHLCEADYHEAYAACRAAAKAGAKAEED